jgi:pimeloyl-ACP methyl ester carboxylesterase
MRPTLTGVPAWFTEALATPTQEGAVDVYSATIRFRAWGPPGGGGVVLIHGGGAHSRWWDHIGPLLAEERRVVALDLSGHGDSGRRTAYGFDVWAEEVLAACEAGGIAGPAAIVGHSLGGHVALRAAHRHGSRLLGAVVIDSIVRSLTPDEEFSHRRQATTPLRVYGSRDEAVSRFRTVPDQWSLPFVLDHVAETSVGQVEGGWSWKFDPLVFLTNSAINGDVPPVHCPAILLEAEHGLRAEYRLRTGLSPQSEELERTAVMSADGAPVPRVVIPDAAHHVMLDSPIALTATLRTLISAWCRWPPSW